MPGAYRRRLTIPIAAFIAVFAVLVATLMVSVSPAEAAPKYRSCRGLTAKFEHGVARTAKAAKRQKRDGFYRPRISKSVYKRHRSLDRDRDGTVCEKRRPKPAKPAAPVDPWMTLDTNSMLPLKVMDFRTGTSLDASNGFSFDMFFDTADTYIEEIPALSDGTPVTGFGGEYYSNPKLIDGKAYQFTLTVNTPSYWDCSIYNPNGCTYKDPTRDVMVWSFTYAAEPGVIKDATKVSWRRRYL